MNRPIISSDPGRSAGLPDTVVPKQTSRSPPYRNSAIAQAPWIRVFTVTRASLANRSSRRARSGGSARFRQAVSLDWCDRTGGRSYGSGVGAVNPAIARLQ